MKAIWFLLTVGLVACDEVEGTEGEFNAYVDGTLVDLQAYGESVWPVLEAGQEAWAAQAELQAEEEWVRPRCDTNVRTQGFEPRLEWEYSGLDNEKSALAIPLVADLTGDGSPEVVVNLYARGDYFGLGHLHVLDGRTGELIFRVDHPVSAPITSAIGDIDGDGLPEIVSFGPAEGMGDDAPTSRYGALDGRLLAFNHDGSLKWAGDTFFFGGEYPIALADLDADGDVEILIGGHVADHEGRMIFQDDSSLFPLQATTAADLDGDGQMEVIRGLAASRLDGSVYYDHSDLERMVYGPAEFADIDGDRLPEVVVHTPGGPVVIENDGVVTKGPYVEGSQAPEGVCQGFMMAGAIGDMDGDSDVELVVNGGIALCALDHEFNVLGEMNIWDDGYAGITAFDFLGDGKAEMIQGDLTCLRLLSLEGELLWATERDSVTHSDFPIIVDVDGDGSAELLTVNNAGYDLEGEGGPGEHSLPALQVFGSEGWAGARRIWNQHAYHTTNINDDATIPQFATPLEESPNSFRMMHVVSPE